jgi:hypothetical protein
MPAAIAMFVRGARHLALGVAILAVLAATLRVHLHAEHIDDHGHRHAPAFGIAGLDLGQGGDGDCGDGCGDCQCPAPVFPAAPDQAALALPDQVGSALRQLRQSAAPDSVSHPPDPPPARQG